MVRKLSDLLPCLNVPEHASHVAGRSQDAAVVDEAAATEITGMAAQLTRHTRWSFSRAQVVDGADIVKTAACHVIATRCISTGHDP